jgi:hypothetical protein
MPTTYMDGSVTTDTILTLDSNYVALMRCKVFFPGNGVDAYTVLSAFFTQDTHSVAVKVNGATTFSVPAFGRWSDYSSIAGFTVPGDIHLLTTCKYTVPMYTNYGGGQIVPTPTDPVVNTPVDIAEVTSTETITVTDNSLIQAGDTITITGVSA